MMKITIVYGNERKGSTRHCTEMMIEELKKYGEVETTAFVLPKDMPHFCRGCFSCIYNGETTCPHAAAMAPIIESLKNADLIVLASPVYGLDVSGPMKSLIDHLCFQWMSHRPQASMFGKMGLTVVTTAGAGLSHTTKTMKNSLKFWGVKRIFSYKKAVSASKWSEVSEKRQAQIKKQTAKLAKQIAKTYKTLGRRHSPFFRTMMFHAMSGMMKKNTWNLTDRNHWEQSGWLSGKKPY